MAEDILKMMQVAYSAEWALSKYFGAVVDEGIMKRFLLTSISGRENAIDEAIARLASEIYKRNIDVASAGGEKRNVEVQNRNAQILIGKLQNLEVPYFKINGTCTLPDEAYDLADVVVIHSKNTTHVDYIREAIQRGKHVLCEKPIVATLDASGNPIDSQFKELEQILAAHKDSKLVLMDAEHYSYKTASLTFYEKIDQILHGRKIVEIYGEILEKDDPFHKRTKMILNPENGTGLMGDTMCHLLAFISNLGGTSTPESREYSKFSGKNDQGDSVDYKVDTYNDVNFRVEGCHYIRDGAKAEFKVGKFIGLMKDEKKAESKYIEFKLDDNSTVRLDFRNGSVVEKNGSSEKKFFPLYSVNSNEYVNILHHFYHAIKHGTQPLTAMQNSMRTMDAIIRAYKIGGDDAQVYK